MCYDCYANSQTDIRCRLCNKRTLYVRIKAIFFRSIEETIHEMISKMIEEAGTANKTTSEAEMRRNVYPLRSLSESMILMPRSREHAMYTLANEIIWSHKHNKNCQLYHNIGYISQSVARIRGGRAEVEGQNITIHDVLAFVCAHCGHGSMNQRKLADGEVKDLQEHRMYNCSQECCGEYLDRRFLQYGGGRCECGVLIMQALGIQPATDKQEEWRKKMFTMKITSRQVRQVLKILAPTFRAMELNKPYMVAWYVITKGDKYLKALVRMSGGERQACLWNVAEAIATEYGVHKPIQ